VVIETPIPPEPRNGEVQVNINAERLLKGVSREVS